MDHYAIKLLDEVVEILPLLGLSLSLRSISTLKLSVRFSDFRVDDFPALDQRIFAKFYSF